MVPFGSQYKYIYIYIYIYTIYIPNGDLYIHGALLCIANPAFCVWFTLTPSHLSLAWHGLTPHKQNLIITWMLFGGIIGTIIIIIVCLIVVF
jgi:hypothetical protein